MRNWTTYAACTGMPTDAFMEEWPIALRVCENCGVTRYCLDDALANDDLGVRGGTTYDQRQKLSLLERDRYLDADVEILSGGPDIVLLISHHAPPEVVVDEREGPL